MKQESKRPIWEYKDHPNKSVLTTRAKELLVWLRSIDKSAQLEHAKDTRECHRFYFKDVVPEGCENFAGHYRGANFPYLERYEVRIPGDSRVGHSASLVLLRMDGLSNDIQKAVALFDLQVKEEENSLQDPVKLIKYVRITVAIFVYFLEVHPYANGNGHMARALMLLLFARYDIYPSSGWSIDPRPADPPYSNLISLYRDGNHDPLVKFVLSHI